MSPPFVKPEGPKVDRYAVILANGEHDLEMRMSHYAEDGWTLHSTNLAVHGFQGVSCHSLMAVMTRRVLKK